MTILISKIVSNYWPHLLVIAGILTLALCFAKYIRNAEKAKQSAIQAKLKEAANAKSDALSDKYSHLLK